ncbi:hypothetical protein CPC08DRAFT_814891 [Agrocybe pediades]|nr:hypothetical protein CPC08DRAFT_814891 [Agrocybe pediades]
MPMPTPTSKYDQHPSPPSMTSTPSRSSYFRSPSNNYSYSPTVTSGSGQPKLNIVSRVAIEGKAKRGQDGASIRMYLKISLPVDSVTPGSSIPLFPEENVKIHTSQVHPLDHNGVPYNFSSTVSPLLHSAAKALNLPPRSHESFNTVFGLTKLNGSAAASRSLKTDNGEHAHPIDTHYTGQILVSGYSISFVTPRVFLSSRNNASDTEESSIRTPSSLSRRRRHSIGERNQVLFMAAIDMWVPFLSRPPRSPYLLSIPTPRCLHNRIKFRIFPPPANASSSFASLSSVEEDTATWDLISEPHVTRVVSSRPSRSNTHFADDESSDSSTTHTADACVVQGTFPSAEHVKIRWAKPMKTLNIPGDDAGRRRVGVEDAKGEMTCTIRGKGTSLSNPDVEGILMDIEYKGQCSGIWFPGVATLLGLDIGLEARGSGISWPEGYPGRWEVSGSDDFTGFDHGSSSLPSNLNSRASSLESSMTQSHPASTATPEAMAPHPLLSKRNSSSASLLRAPLPAQNVADYSFEGSSGNLSSTMSHPTASMISLTNPSISSSSHPTPQTPGAPITLHLDMNELPPPTKNVFTLRVTGTILVTSRATLAKMNGLNGSNTPASGKYTESEPVTLPRFTVLAADSESTSTTIRNESEGMLVEVFTPNGDVHQDPQTRKTVLQKNGFTRCGEEGGRISLKYSQEPRHPSANGNVRPPNRPRTPSNTIHRVPSNSNLPRAIISTRSKRDGPPIIPWVTADVTTLAPDADMFPTGYAIRLTLPTPVGLESEWLEFGIASSPPINNPDSHSKTMRRKVHIICASLDGVPVKAETTKATTTVDGAISGAQFEDISGKNWVCWGKVHVGGSMGGIMVIDYIVNDQDVASAGQGKKRSNDSSVLNILLPTFFVSVARLEVLVDSIPGLEIASLRSNFDYHYSSPKGNRLLRFSMDEFSQPQLSLTIRHPDVQHSISKSGFSRYVALTWSLLLAIIILLYHHSLDVHKLQTANEAQLDMLDVWKDIPTFTVTTTVFGNTETNWCAGGQHPTVNQVTASPTANPEKITTPTTTVTNFSPNIEFMTASTADVAQPTSEPSQHDPMKDTSLTSNSLRTVLEKFGLIPLERLISSWADDQADLLGRVSEKVKGTVEVVWNIFRKMYHYPLDPP